LDPDGMDTDELLYHFCAKLGKLSRSDSITAKTDSVAKDVNLSRRDFLAGIKNGFQVFSDFPLTFEDACEAKYGCRKCIDACPVGALEFGSISGLTIQSVLSAEYVRGSALLGLFICPNSQRTHL